MDKPAAGSHKLREIVCVFMSALPIPAITPAGEPPVMRGDGVLEFYKEWRVRGNSSTDCLTASYSDTDDIIEFGLTERDGEIVRTVLQVSMNLDGANADLFVMSDTNTELNAGDVLITPDAAELLNAALSYFGKLVRGEE